MQEMQKEFKPNSIQSKAVLIAVILFITASLFGVLEIYQIYRLNQLVSGEITQFNKLVESDKYEEARELFINVSRQTSGNKREQAIEQMKEELASKVKNLSNQILSEKLALTTQQIKGLQLFKTEISSKLDSELEKVTLQYMDGKIDYKTFAHYIEEIAPLDLPDIGKYQALARAEELKRKLNFKEAAVILEAIGNDYPDDLLLTQKISEYEKEAAKLVVYKGPVQHIFFHPMIAYPELAFDGDSLSKGYNDYFITVKEFKKILESLYGKNYVLINLNSLYEEKAVDGSKKLVKKELLLPQGKKPLIISIDDLNYYDYMQKNGNVSKLILDNEGNIATLSVSQQGETVISRDNEIVPILDRFIERHPDFSFQGAKGIINLTGYQGILGYRTNLSSPIHESEREKVLPIIKRLKETGWLFASHGWGHLDAQKISYSILVRDTERWKREVETLVGPVSVYVYPYGSSVLPGDAKYRYLVEAGFKVLAGIGPKEYLKFRPDSIMMDRRHIDGIAILTQSSTLQDLFDSSKVIDSARPRKQNP